MTRSSLVRRAVPAVLLAVSGLVVPATIASAQDDPTVAPATTTSADGRSVSGAGKTLSVSQADGLDPAGTTVRVTGQGYDEAKGVYVSVCVVPPPDAVPSPCGGGEDRANESGASAWVSSDPPSYAVGLTTPYGPGGSFDVSISFGAALNESLDCRQVQCAIVTRNDHTRGSDRSQDLFVPISFAADSAATTTTLPAPTTTAPTTTTTIDPRSVVPAISVGDDGRSVTDGVRTVALSASSVAPGGTVAVDGTGFDAAGGVFVALCAFGVDGVPGPCATGTDRAAWISSVAAGEGTDLARPYADGGTFSVGLTLDPVIDVDTDCRVVPCGVGTRADAPDGGDRRSDLFVPVTFDAPAPGDVPDTGDAPVVALDGDSAVAVAPTGDDPDDGLSPIALVAVVLLVGVAGAGVVVARRGGA